MLNAIYLYWFFNDTLEKYAFFFFFFKEHVFQGRLNGS